MADNSIISSKYAVDTSKLEVGQLFKNKKALCEYIGQEYIPNKTASEPQLKEWRRYFDWDKEGQKIMITEIYPKPLDKKDGRVVNGTQIYQRFIEDILLAYISSQVASGNAELREIEDKGNVYDFTFTTNQFAYLCGMVNEKYITKNIEPLLLSMGFTSFNIRDFFSRTESKFNAITNNTLNNMQKRKIIDYEKQYIVVANRTSRISTLDDKLKIMNIERETLNEMSYNTVNDVFIHNRAKEYYKNISAKAKEKFGWDYFFRVYTIYINDRSLILQREFLIQTNQQNKLELNDKLTEFFDKQVNNKIIKSNSDLVDFTLPFDYEEQQIALSDYLLKIDGEN